MLKVQRFTVAMVTHHLTGGTSIHVHEHGILAVIPKAWGEEHLTI